MADTVVLDTDVVSFLFKSHPNAVLYRPHIESATRRLISFMTVAELDRWSLAQNWGAKRISSLQAALRKYVVHYANRDLCRVWAEVTQSATQSGQPIDPADAWIAATAVFQRVPLITHNRSHFLGVDGLEIISEQHPR